MFDLTGAFVEGFYNKETDVLLNPFDVRCPAWSPFADARTREHFKEFSQALIPMTEKGDSFWQETARILFVETCVLLVEQGRGNNKALAEVLMTSKLKDLRAHVARAIAAPLTDPEAKRMAKSIRACYGSGDGGRAGLAGAGSFTSAASMISVPGDVRIWIALGRTDMRKGMRGLALQVIARPMAGQDRYQFKDVSGILGHARVSTGDQDVAGQTMRLEQAGALKVFTDVRSGKSMDRPGLTELLAYARAGDTLAVVRLDRLGRSLGELLTVVKELKERGVALLSPEEKIDTSSAAGELVFHVFGAIAQFERRLNAERTKDGIVASRAKGKLPGRRPLNPVKASAALKLVEAGVSPTKAARQLGLGRATVYREMATAGVRRSG